MRLRLHLAVACTVAALAAGCGGRADGIPREPVSGTVSLDGQPLESGSITFLPEGSGPSAGGPIQGGSFTLPRADGPAPGPHRVEVMAIRPTGRKVPNPDDPGQMIEETYNAVPPRYNLRSELTAEVKAGAENKFDFTLSGKAAPRASR